MFREPTKHIGVSESPKTSALQVNGTDAEAHRNTFSGFSESYLRELLNSPYERVRELAEEQLRQRHMWAGN